MALSRRPDLHLFIERLTSRTMLTAKEQQAIYDLPFHAEQIQPNRDFVCLGEATDHSCLIVAGWAGRFGQNAEGQRQITALHIPGDMADLHSVVQPRAASALQALSVTTILRVPHAAIRRAAARYPAIAEALWRDCAVDAAILSQWVVNVGRRDARARISHLLCEAACRLGVDPAAGKAEFQFPITQAQLADATGLTPVHVCRVLTALRAEGLVHIHDRMVMVSDWNALVEAGEFDMRYLQIGMKPVERLRMSETA